MLRSLKHFNATKSCHRRMFTVYTIPIRRDNYSYLISDPETRDAAAVDPEDADKVMQCISKNGLNLKFILTTHHHADHAGGNSRMLKLAGHNVPVYGGDRRVQAVSHVLLDSSWSTANPKIKLGQNVTIVPIHTPGHTTSHITFHATDGSAPPADRPEEYMNFPKPLEHSTSSALFTGDTLFVSGCGRFFESQHDFGIMHRSLTEKLAHNATVSAGTLVFCGHEYTASNLEFARHVDPGNKLVEKMLAAITQVQKKHEDSGHKASLCCTVPSTVAQERLANPFLRAREILTDISDAHQALGKLRELKDSF